MTRGKYIRTEKWKEEASKRNTSILNPAYRNGSYSKQIIDNKIQAMLEAKQKLMNETYQNKEWLFQKYCLEKIPISQIVKDCKVEFETIWDSLRELGIPRISMTGRQYWYAWVEKEKHEKAKQDKAFRQFMENDQDKTKGRVAIKKIDRYKTLINQ
jgi:membrane-associated HD superfamily phosphohydrolase